MKRDSMVSAVVAVLIVAIILFFGVQFEIYRWHTFQEITHSDISFWKWQFLFNNSK